MNLSQLDPSKFYLMSGSTLMELGGRQDRLWAGDNIQRGPGILRRGAGTGGFTLATMPGGKSNPSTGGASTHPFLPYDVSAGGPNGLISVTAGSVTDLTNSGTVWTGMTGPNLIYMNDPIAGNVPFALPLTGPPVRQPYLQLDPAATCAYLSATVNATTGYITAMEIDGDTGGGVPASTSTNWYSLLSTLSVTITGGVAKVTINNDGAQSNLFFAICGVLPLTGGGSYVVGT